LTWIVAHRPVSHAAAAAIVATSAYAVHAGASAALPAGLAGAATAALIGFEWLQWTALGRLAAIERVGDDSRAAVLKAMSVGIGGLQIGLYSFAAIAIAGEGGMDWGRGWALAGVLLGAAIYAGLNFVAKYASCDPIDVRTSSPTGGRRAPVHSAIFEAAPALPDFSNDDNVVTFDLEKAIRTKMLDEKDAKDERQRATGETGFTKARARRTRNRIHMRVARAAKAA
jgi:hypothetical protein